MVAMLQDNPAIAEMYTHAGTRFIQFRDWRDLSGIMRVWCHGRSKGSAIEPELAITFCMVITNQMPSLA